MTTGKIERIHVFHGTSRELGQALAARLRPAFPDREIVVWSDEAELRAGLPEVEALFAFRLPRGGWSAARRLRLLHSMGAGVDGLLPAPDLPAQVKIANARGIHGPQMAELAVGLLLALAKRIPHALEQQRAHLWKPYGMTMLGGRTLGILGFGSIGAAVAERARALGMRVIGTQRTPKPSPHAERIVGADQTAEVLRESDALVVLLPLTAETRGAIGARELGMLPAGSLLVNLARGGIVDEAALLDALRSGRLGGAALDVFAEEPLPSASPLWDAPNLIATPHIAGMAPDYMERLTEILVENLARTEQGLPLRNPVERERGY